MGLPRFTLRQVDSSSSRPPLTHCRRSHLKPNGTLANGSESLMSKPSKISYLVHLLLEILGRSFSTVWATLCSMRKLLRRKAQYLHRLGFQRGLSAARVNIGRGSMWESNRP